MVHSTETISFSGICFSENLFVEFGCMLISFSTKSFCGFFFHKTFLWKFASLAFPQNRCVGFFPQNASVEIWFISFFTNTGRVCWHVLVTDNFRPAEHLQHVFDVHRCNLKWMDVRLFYFWAAVHPFAACANTFRFVKMTCVH